MRGTMPWDEGTGGGTGRGPGDRPDGPPPGREQLRALRQAWLAQLSIPRLRRERAARSGLDEMLDLAYTFEHRGVSLAPFQRRGEVRDLLRLVERERPASVLEIGTANGGTLFLLARCASDDAHLISVDLGGGPFGGGYPLWRAPLYRSFAGPGQRVSLLRADSHLPGTVRRVRGLLAGRGLDLLFIDGDHSYAGVSRDFELYAPLVRDGGIIALHDIVPGEERSVGGVPRFWTELREGRPHEEFVEDWGQGGFGIGALRAGRFLP